jgi:hypothetical protein
MPDCTEILRPALEEHLDSYQIRQDQHECELVTPFQKPDGDLIRVWVRGIEANNYVITDYGETFAMLEMQGVNPQSRARSEDIERIWNRYSLSTANDEVRIETTVNQLPTRIFDAIQAIQAVSYLIYTHERRSRGEFNTEVEAFFDDVGYQYDRDFSAPGQNEERKFDFRINHRRPYIVVDTLHSTSRQYLKQQTETVKLNWHEIKEQSGIEHAAIVDDVNGEYDEATVGVLEERLDHFFRWQQKRQITQEIPVRGVAGDR